MFGTAPQMMLAKAQYDNAADSSEELSFRRGDVVTVLEKDPGGLDGWWLCSLHGRQGIAPGNRLKMLAGMYDDSGGGNNIMTRETPPGGKDKWVRRSWLLNPDKVVTPKKVENVYLYEQGDEPAQDYDVPKTRYFTPEPGDFSEGMDSPVDPNDTYDTPGNARSITVEVTPQIVYDCSPASGTECLQGSAFGPSSNRSSTVSVHSNASNTTASSNSSNAANRSAPSSACHSARSSVEVSGMDIYDVPPPPKAITDGPPASSMDESLSKQFPLEITDIYDSPPALTGTGRTESMLSCDMSMGSSDSPKVPERLSAHNSLLDTYNTPSKLRSSLLSNQSELSDCDEKARISAMELYDTPSRLKNISLNSSKVSVHDMTGTPVRLSDTLSYLDKSAYDDYDVPKSVGSARSSGDSGIESSKLDAIYDVPPKNLADDSCNDVYDVPTSNSAMIKYALADIEKVEQKSRIESLKATSKPGPSTVYDIPPQVTRDIPLPPKQRSLAGDSNVSLCSIDTRGPELPLQVDAALEILLKLQQEVQRAIKEVLTHIVPGWRQPTQLAPQIYNLRQACHKLRTALEELTQFGQGALANSRLLSDNRLTNRLAQELQPLQIALSNLTHYLSMLTDRWDVPNLAVETPQAEDELANIVAVTRSLPDRVTSFTSLVQGYSTLLFKHTADKTRTDATDLSHPEPIGTSTPKGKATPPPVRPKPSKLNRNASFGQSLESGNESGGEEKKGSSIQDRPLPPPPPGKMLSRPGTHSSSTSLKTRDPSPGRKTKVRGEGEQEYDYVHLTPDTEDPPTDLPPVLPSKSVTRQSQLEGLAMSEPGTLEREPSPALQQEHEVPTKDTEGREPSSIICTESIAVESLDSGRLSRCSDEMSSEGSGTPGTRTSGLSAKFQARLERLQQEAQQEVNVHTTEPPVPQLPEKTKRHSRLCDSDRQILGFYANEVGIHSDLLVNACDAFFNCIDYNQPPKVFIAHSRFVILAAHKMVYIADTITRYTYSEEVRNKITVCATALCGALKVAVSSTKQAALQFPAVQAVQDMVDRVVDVSHASQQLKGCITQSTKL